jgi:TetR/AcrR family transcriptional repressor of nem operon
MMVEWITQVFTLGVTDGSILDVRDPMAEAAAMLSLIEGAQLAARAEENPDLFESAVALMQQRLQ